MGRRLRAPGCPVCRAPVSIVCKYCRPDSVLPLVLAADLVVVAVTRNRPGFHYGQWRVWGSCPVPARTLAPNPSSCPLRALQRCSPTQASHAARAGVLGPYPGARGVPPVPLTPRALVVANAPPPQPQPYGQRHRRRQQRRGKGQRRAALVQGVAQRHLPHR